MKNKSLLLCAFLLLGMLKASGAEEDYKSLSFHCDEKATLAKQLTDEMAEQVESLTISGTLWGEDIEAIDRCSHLSNLDLTEATLKEEVTFYEDSEKYDYAIGKNAFCHTAIETLYLPKVIGYFDLQALSLFAWDKDCGRQAADWWKEDYTDEPHFEKTITVYVTGSFPNILNPQSISGYYGCPMEFKLAKGNELYTEVDGNIYSKDGTMLIKAGNLYDESLKNHTFDVQSVYCFAFTYSLWSYEHQLITFSEKIDHIYASAFAEVAVPYVTPDKASGHFGGVRFLGWTPPTVGGGFFYVHRTDPDLFPCCKAIVPSKTRYIASNIWWMPYVMDEFEYGVQCGTMTHNEKDIFYSKQDQYCPRMEKLYELLSKSIFREAIIKGYTCIVDGENLSGLDITGYVEVSILLNRSIPLSFINPKTGGKETINFDFKEERFDAEIILYGADGKKWDNVPWNGQPDHIIPGYSLNWIEDYNIFDTANIGDKCYASIQLNGLKFLGLLPGYQIEGVFERYDAIQSIHYRQQTIDNHSFDLQGRPADGGQKGILIRNGKKVLVK